MNTQFTICDLALINKVSHAIEPCPFWLLIISVGPNNSWARPIYSLGSKGL